MHLQMSTVFVNLQNTSDLQMHFTDIDICKSSSARMCAMYDSTNNWQEFGAGYLKSRGGVSEIKNRIPITLV